MEPLYSMYSDRLRVIPQGKGAQLMREWGLPDWPGVEATYFLWREYCVFATRNERNYTELHMAMPKEHRHECRNAVSAMLMVLGGCEIRAPILGTAKSVCNLASKFGFVYTGVEMYETPSGEVKQGIVMTRRATWDS